MLQSTYFRVFCMKSLKWGVWTDPSTRSPMFSRWPRNVLQWYWWPESISDVFWTQTSANMCCKHRQPHICQSTIRWCTKSICPVRASVCSAWETEQGRCALYVYTALLIIIGSISFCEDNPEMIQALRVHWSTSFCVRMSLSSSVSLCIEVSHRWGTFKEMHPYEMHLFGLWWTRWTKSSWLII